METATTEIVAASEQSTEDNDEENLSEVHVIIRLDRIIPFDGQEVTLAPMIYDEYGNKIEDTSDYSFQWAEYSYDDDVYVDIDGANEPTYTFKADPLFNPLADIGYTVTVTDPNGVVGIAYYMPQDKNRYFSAYIEHNEYVSYDGEDTTLQVNLYDGDGRLIEDTSDYSFQWYDVFADDGSYTEIEDATESSLTYRFDPEMLENEDYVACYVSNNAALTTNYASFQGYDKSTHYDVKVDGEEYIDLNGEDVTAEATVYDTDGNQLTDEDLHYQWEYWSDDEWDYVTMDGETSPVLTITAKEENLKEYRLTVTNPEKTVIGYGYYEPKDKTVAAQEAMEDARSALILLDGEHIDLRDKEYIEAARTAYDALTPEQQEQIPEYLLDNLTDAEDRYNALKAEDK